MVLLRHLPEEDALKTDHPFLTPFADHTIRNTSPEENLEILFIWWGGVDGEEAQRRVLA